MASLPSKPKLSHVDPISGKPEKLKKQEAHFMPSQLNPAQSAQRHSRRTTLPSEVNDSLHPSSGPTDPGSSTMVTVNPDIPGAFPTATSLKKKGEEQDRIQHPPSTVDEVKHAVEVLSDYAKLYLPVSVGAYLGSRQEEGEEIESGAGVPKTELPSTEVPSGSRVGVNLLPDEMFEPGVAALPEEKAGKCFSAMTVPDSGGSMSRAHRASFPPSDSLPEGGIGSLSGTPNEADVVRLPEGRLPTTEVSAHDSSSAVQSKVSQEFPLLQETSKISTNPFRNGHFAYIGTGQTSDRNQPEDEDDPITCYPSEFAVVHAIPPGLKEPHATPEQHRALTPGGRGISREPSLAVVGRQFVSGEELETLLEREGVTPRSVLRDPEPAISEGSSAQMTPAELNIPSPYGLVQESVTSNSPHPPALAAELSDAPTPANERELLEMTEPSPNASAAADMMQERAQLIDKDQNAPFDVRVPSSVTGVGAAVPLIPVSQSQDQNPIQASTVCTEPPTKHSPNKTPPYIRDRSRDTSWEKAGNPTTMPEKPKEEKKSRGLFPWLSGWFHRRKSKSPVRREREREEMNEDLEELPEHGKSQGAGNVDEFASLTDPVAQTQQLHVGAMAGPVPTAMRAEGQQKSRDIQHSDPTHPSSTVSRGRELSTAFIGTGTLSHQQLHQPPITTEASVDAASEHVQRPARRRSRGHRSHSPVIPKKVPAHFDETIGPLPDHVEKRSGKELPSREKPSGSRVGIGSLPGEDDEEGVALSPDERFATTVITSIPHTPAPEGLGSAPSRMLADVPPPSNITLGMCGTGNTNDSEFSLEKGQAKPPLYVTPQHRYVPQEQPNVVGYIPQTTQPLQTFKGDDRLLSDDRLHPKLEDKEVQTEASKSMPFVETSGTRAFTVPPAPELVLSPSSGIFSLEHARQEEQERLREIESGQRKTIFTAAEEPYEPDRHILIRPLQQQKAKTLPKISESSGALRDAGFERYSPSRTGLEVPTSAADMPRCVQSTQMNAPAATSAQDTDLPRQVLDPSVMMLEQRSVPLRTEFGTTDPTVQVYAPFPYLSSSVPVPEERPDMEPSNAEAELVSTSVPLVYRSQEYVDSEGPITEDEIYSERPNRKSPSRESEGSGAQGGFFEGFIHRDGENVEDNTRRHVQPSVGEYLSYHEQLERETRQDLASEPGAQIYSQQSQTQGDIGDLGAQQWGPLSPDSVSTSHFVTELSPAQKRKPVSRVVGDNPTPLEMSLHPSSAEGAKPPRAPFSTHEKISGRPSEVIPSVREQYVRSIVNEPGEMVGAGGSLPGYPGPAALSALIGERIYDEHMRAAGAGEPIQTTERQLHPELATAEEPPVTPTSLLRSTVGPQTTNASALLVPRKDAPRIVPGSFVSELGSPLTGAPVRAVDLSGGIGVSSLSGQPAMSPSRLRSTLREEAGPRVYSEREMESTSREWFSQSSAGSSATKRSGGKGLNVDDLGAPIVSRETGLKSFLDEQIGARKTSHN